MTLKLPTASDLPRSIPIMNSYDRLTAAFPSSGKTHTVAISAPAAELPQVQGGRGKALEAMVAADPLFAHDQQPDDPYVCRPARSRPSTSASTPSPVPRWRPKSLHELRNALVPQTIGERARCEVRGRRRHRRADRLRLQHAELAAVRHRLRPRPDVPDHAGDVPLDRHRAHLDRAQPALGRRGVRRAGAGLPAHLGRGAAGLHTPPARWWRGCRCSCSWCCSDSRWTTTCSSSAGSARRRCAASRPRTRCGTASPPRPASSPARQRS